ncbi:hypothetical protein C5B28_13360 [Neisseria gonorrhoeae]|uniref:hypothetical protein n=1 Tax=Neisseria gonorrhoeae TaxID=485 RepID=UPI000CF1BF26|nr:hypothetical protein [Neisseria gonorrhoeae]PPZ69884.1 hypothetical protein C5B28_13360 [Neisseria gonorrhoeae]
MPNPNDPTMKDMQDLYEHIKTWHMLVNKKLDEAIECNYPVTLKGPSEEEVIKISDPEALKHIRIGLMMASALIKPFPFYSDLEVEINEGN